MGDEKEKTWWQKNVEDPAWAQEDKTREIYKNDPINRTMHDIRVGVKKGVYYAAKDMAVGLFEVAKWAVLLVAKDPETEKETGDAVASIAKGAWGIAKDLFRAKFGSPETQKEVNDRWAASAEKLLNAIAKKVGDEWEKAGKEGKRAELISHWTTRGVVEIASFFIGVGEVKAASKARKAGDFLSHCDDPLKYADEAADAAKAAARAKAIQTSNMVPDHAEAFSQVANARGEIIMLRPVNPDATTLIAKNYGTKPMTIKGKSSDWGPHKGTIPVDQKYSKMGKPGKTPDPDEIRLYNNYNKKALGQPYETPIKDADGKIIGWEPHPAVPPVAKTTTVEGPDGPIEVLADLETGQPITADYDLFAVGSKDGPGTVGWNDNTGAISSNESALVDDLNQAVKDKGYEGGNVVHHGPANRFADKLEPGDYPVTAFTPDGNVHTINNEDELRAFYQQQNEAGYQLEAHEGWGFGDDIPTTEAPPH